VNYAGAAGEDTGRRVDIL